MGKMKWKLDADDGWSTQQSNNKLVWDETIRILEELFEQQWGSQKVVTYQHVVDLTLPVSRHLSFWIISVHIRRFFLTDRPLRDWNSRLRSTSVVGGG